MLGFSKPAGLRCLQLLRKSRPTAARSPRCSRLFPDTPAHWTPLVFNSTKTARSSNQFTFSTKYPRQRPSGNSVSKGPNSNGTKRTGGGNKGPGKRMPGLALPARLRLATFKPPPSTPGKQEAKPDAAKFRKSSDRPTTPLRLRKRKTSDSKEEAPTEHLAGRRKKSPVSTQKLSHKAALAKEEDAIKMAKHTAKFALTATRYDTTRPEALAVVQERIRDSRFEEMGLRAELLSAVKNVLGYERPTQVQALCIPEILSSDGNALLCAAETGGGKTAAYLLPIINRLKDEEEKIAASVSDYRIDAVEAITADGTTASSTSGLSTIRKLRRPRAVIIVPSRELVAQVTLTAKAICHSVRLRVVGAHAGMPAADVEAKIASAPVDILVSTPGSLNYLMRQAGFALSQTRHLVVDEADTMTDEDFGPELDTILKHAAKFVTDLDRSCQFVFVSATVPLTLVRTLDRHFPDHKRVTTPTVHRTVPSLRQRFVRIDGSTTKQSTLLDILKRAVIEDDRLIVFCNTRRSCEDAARALKEKGYDAYDISSNVHVKDRTKALKRFAAPSEVPAASESSVRKPIIMVATDIASRGLDTINVGHVILYDFPQTAIDYLHRVGRTARNGARGRATSIISKKDRRIADRIEEGVKRKTVLA
ncbi:hypothetical protein HKX48_008113 [Thoreauomyces humboldtii]|nr:hypothetical protein HKX48_008113 [Thoreauomyces humboldtii]